VVGWLVRLLWRLVGWRTESVQTPPSYDDLARRVTELTSLLSQALTRIADLEARLKQSSSNSSKPPSSDGLAKPAPRSLRGRSGRGPGRPKGQDGTTLQRVAEPDVVIRHLPDVCGAAVAAWPTRSRST
jgi:hypothetical protein